MRPDVNSCVNSIRIFATSNNYMWTTGNLLKERNFPQASLLSHLPKQIKFFPNEFKFPGSLRKTCLSVIGWGNSVITTYKKKSRENWICPRIWKPGGTIPWYIKKKRYRNPCRLFLFILCRKVRICGSQIKQVMYMIWLTGLLTASWTRKSVEYKVGTIREDSWGLRKHRHRRQESSNVTKPPVINICETWGDDTKARM